MIGDRYIVVSPAMIDTEGTANKGINNIKFNEKHDHKIYFRSIQFSPHTGGVKRKNAKRYDKSGIRTHAPFETRNAPKEHV